MLITNHPHLIQLLKKLLCLLVACLYHRPSVGVPRDVGC